MPPLRFDDLPPQTPLPPDRPMGRIFSPDDRDHAYRARALQPLRAGPVKLRKHRIFLPAAPPLRWRPQGNRSSCTEEAGTNRMTGWPNPRKLSDLPYSHYALYARNQELDEWPGSEVLAPYYEGSSGRACCRSLRELGLITEWWNAFTVDEIRNLLLADTTDWAVAGPVTIGTNWYDSMFSRDANGYLHIAAGAKVAGGHQTVLIGANDGRETFYGLNSWPDLRLFRLTYETARRLIEKEDGDGQFMVEVPLNPQVTALNPMEGVLDFGRSDKETPTLSGSPLHGLRMGAQPEAILHAMAWLEDETGADLEGLFRWAA
jgi:hypothetical protein